MWLLAHACYSALSHSSRGRFSDCSDALYILCPYYKPVWHFLTIDLAICERRMVMSGANVVMIVAESYKWYGKLIILAAI